MAGCHSDCCAILSYLPISGGWWSGISVTNLSQHEGSFSIAIVSETEKVLKTYKVPAFGIKTLVVNELINAPHAFAVIKTSFSSRVVGFGGDATGAFALPATGCGACQ